jgi:hypothetical protein
LGRSACWQIGPGSLLTHDETEGTPFAVIGRDRDLPSLKQLGLVEIVARGPSLRRDRTFSLFRIMRGPVEVRSANRVQTRGTY